MTPNRVTGVTILKTYFSPLDDSLWQIYFSLDILVWTSFTVWYWRSRKCWIIIHLFCNFFIGFLAIGNISFIFSSSCLYKANLIWCLMSYRANGSIFSCVSGSRDTNWAQPESLWFEPSYNPASDSISLAFWHAKETKSSGLQDEFEHDCTRNILFFSSIS